MPYVVQRAVCSAFDGAGRTTLAFCEIVLCIDKSVLYSLPVYQKHHFILVIKGVCHKSYSAWVLVF